MNFEKSLSKVITLLDLIQIPVYQCGGTIIPQRMRKRRASILALQDPITLIIALDENVCIKKINVV